VGHARGAFRTVIPLDSAGEELWGSG
jgi:hypothetical protein